MNAAGAQVEGIGDLPQILSRKSQEKKEDLDSSPRIDAQRFQNGLAKFILGIIDTIIQVLERQALLKFEAGALTESEVDKLGAAFAEMKERMSALSEEFGCASSADELGIELNETSSYSGSSGIAKKGSLADVLNTLIEKEAVISGDIRLAVAGIDLVTLRLLATLSPSAGASSEDDDLSMQQPGGV